MRQSAKDMHRKVREAHAAAHEAIVRMTSEVKDCLDIKELADFAYATQDAWKLADDTRKQLNILHELVEKIAGVLWATTSMDGEPIRTEYCTATPNPKPIATIPKRSTDPEAYKTLMLHLGVPEALLNTDNEDKEVIRPHWPGFVDYLTRELAAGRPLPPGIHPDKTYMKYNLSIRAKKGVEE